MTIKEATKKAIEGGFDDSRKCACCWKEEKYCRCGPEARYINPHFWQSLGKALGWKECWYYGWFVKKAHEGTWECREGKDPEVFWGGNPSEYPTIAMLKEAWQYHWHSFIDHLADGKAPEEFFQSL